MILNLQPKFLLTEPYRNSFRFLSLCKLSKSVLITKYLVYKKMQKPREKVSFMLILPNKGL